MIGVHCDSNIGVSGSKIHWMRTKHGTVKYWCRMAIALMGSYNMSAEDIANLSPFDPLFNDNYVEGKGDTKEEALKVMHVEMREIANGIWAD